MGRRDRARHRLAFRADRPTRSIALRQERARGLGEHEDALLGEENGGAPFRGGPDPLGGAGRRHSVRGYRYRGRLANLTRSVHALRVGYFVMATHMCQNKIHTLERVIGVLFLAG